MVIFGLILFLSLSARQTIFNSEYIQGQIEKTNIAETINNQLNSKLQAFGVSQTDIISEDLVNNEVKSMVQDFYDGNEVQLDQNMITNELNQQLGNNNGIIQQSMSSLLANQVVSIFNSQLDTEKLNRYASQVQKLEEANQMVMILSGVGVILTVVVAFFKRRMLRIGGSALIVIGSFVGIISAIAYLSNITGNLPIQYPIVKTIVEQTGNDILIREFTLALGMLILGVIILVGSGFLKLFHKKRE